MNIIKFAIIFVIITLPFHIISYYNVNRIQSKEVLKRQYETIVNNAVDDGTTALRLYTAMNFDDTNKKHIQIDTEEVMNAFLTSYHYGFNAIGTSSQLSVDQYILALVIVGYDGYYLYGTKEVVDESGRTVLMPVISEKKPYIYRTGQYSMKVTLDDYVEVLDRATWKVEKNTFADIVQKPTDIDSSNFESFRRTTIIEAIEKGLKETLIAHNKWSKQLGVNYEFYLPLAEDSGYSRSIDDVSLLVFIQGKPLGNGQYLEITAFNQGSVLSKNRIMGYRDINDGTYYFCYDPYSPSGGDEFIKSFSSKEAAVKEGYWDYRFLGK